MWEQILYAVAGLLIVEMLIVGPPTWVVLHRLRPDAAWRAFVPFAGTFALAKAVGIERKKGAAGAILSRLWPLVAIATLAIGVALLSAFSSDTKQEAERRFWEAFGSLGAAAGVVLAVQGLLSIIPVSMGAWPSVWKRVAHLAGMPGLVGWLAVIPLVNIPVLWVLALRAGDIHVPVATRVVEAIPPN